MAFRWKNDLTAADVTPHRTYLNRRQILAGMAGIGAGSIAAPLAAGELEPNSWEEITSYNNFYEFGTGKADPAAYAGAMTIDPWSIKIDGLVERPGDYDLKDIMKEMTVEERIYRFRCVEAWSMVIPWNGFELADLLNMAGVKEEARYVRFETLARPSEMPGLAYPIIDWPYAEGLRLDEAMHPLTIMATGLYGKPMPKQNGAPIRLVVPWKYGFKSIKSIVRISLVAEQPATSWNTLLPGEYGFYSNVNPNVDHPRWSQASERRVGGGLFARKEPTLLFNGYEKDVAGLYEGMDLARNY